MRRSGISVIAVALAVTLGLAGCGGTTELEPGTDSAPASDVVENITQATEIVPMAVVDLAEMLGLDQAEPDESSDMMFRVPSGAPKTIFRDILQGLSVATTSESVRIYAHETYRWCQYLSLYAGKANPDWAIWVAMISEADERDLCWSFGDSSDSYWFDISMEDGALNDIPPAEMLSLSENWSWQLEDSDFRHVGFRGIYGGAEIFINTHGGAKWGNSSQALAAVTDELIAAGAIYIYFFNGCLSDAWDSNAVTVSPSGLRSIPHYAACRG